MAGEQAGVVARRDDTTRVREKDLTQDGHRLARVSPLPADEHGLKATDQQKNKSAPQKLLGDDFVITRPDVLRDVGGEQPVAGRMRFQVQP
jgi:hypothetical protein